MNIIRYIVIFLFQIAGTAVAFGMPLSAIRVVDAEETDSLSSDSLCADTIVTLTLPEKLDSIFRDKLLQTSQIGFMAYDLTADTLLYAHNEHQTMRPASTMKLLTAIAALDRLGGSYRYATSLKADGNIYIGEDGDEESLTLAGNVIVAGGMDPCFGSDDMHAFIDAIRREHVDTIYGEALADMSFKEPVLLGEGWCWDDDNPVLTALPWNRKDIFMQKFKTMLSDAGIVLLMPQQETDTLMLSDTISSECSAQSAMPVVPAFMRGKKISSADAICCTRYHTIGQILIRMMKRSDNLYAESLFYHLAASKRRPAKAEYAADIMKKLLQKIGVTHTNYRIADGSGLSLYNYQTADMQIRLLRYAYQNANIFEHLYPSLPIAGVDGTLQKRMRNTICHDNVRGKTGTLTGISSLSGYLTAANGNVIAYAIINQGVMRAAHAKTMQDRICQALCEYK